MSCGCGISAKKPKKGRGLRGISEDQMLCARREVLVHAYRAELWDPFSKNETVAEKKREAAKAAEACRRLQAARSKR